MTLFLDALFDELEKIAEEVERRPGSLQPMTDPVEQRRTLIGGSAGGLLSSGLGYVLGRRAADSVRSFGTEMTRKAPKGQQAAMIRKGNRAAAAIPLLSALAGLFPGMVAGKSVARMLPRKDKNKKREG